MPTDNTVIRRIHALRQMTVAELRGEWDRLFGEPTRFFDRIRHDALTMAGTLLPVRNFYSPPRRTNFRLTGSIRWIDR